MGDKFTDYVDALGRRVYLVKSGGVLDGIVISLFKERYPVLPDSLRIAILGDLHGHITLALERLSEWVRYSGLPLDAILQVGDLGVFDPTTPLDKVTLEISRKDPDELGFRNYLERSQEADRFFAKQGVFFDVPLYFIDGNHDDQSLLALPDAFRTAYDNIRYIPSGCTIQVQKGPMSVDVSALGWHHARPDVKMLDAFKIGVLLTHDLPAEPDLVRIVQSADYHFFGHTHKAALLQSAPHKNSYGLNEVRKDGHGKINASSFGLLDVAQSGRSVFIYLP